MVGRGPIPGAIPFQIKEKELRWTESGHAAGGRPQGWGRGKRLVQGLGSNTGTSSWGELCKGPPNPNSSLPAPFQGRSELGILSSSSFPTCPSNSSSQSPPGAQDGVLSSLFPKGRRLSMVRDYPECHLLALDPVVILSGSF